MDKDVILLHLYLPRDPEAFLLFYFDHFYFHHKTSNIPLRDGFTLLILLQML